MPSLQIPRSPLDFSLSFRDPNLLGALHVGNDFLWHPKAFGPIVGLLVHLDGYHLVIFLLQEIRCGGLLVHLVGVGVGELIGLVTFLLAYVANHGLSFIKLLHSLVKALVWFW